MKDKKLEEFENDIIGKKVAIIGIGVSNLPLLDYFHEKNVKVTVFDQKDLSHIDDEIIEKIEEYGFDMFTGEKALDNLIGYNLIFRAPSCRPDTPQIVKEVERGAILTSEIEMVLKLCPGKMIGITGTEGKTTTTSLIYEMIKQSGKTCFLGGNIGKPIFTQIKDMKPEDIVVLELSSFQLMNVNVSPEVAVVTNIYPDHLNVHKSYEEYRETKKNIFQFQHNTGITVLNYDNEFTRKFAKDAKGEVIFFSSQEKLKDGYIYDTSDETIKYCKEGVRRHLLKREEIYLRGIHNYENICAALAATSPFVEIETQIQAIKNFQGVPHRLEFVKEIEGSKWYNDSIGTSPASTIAGLNSFDENIILLAGGSDKGLDYTEIGKVIAQKVGTLILTGPTAEKIEFATKKALGNRTIEICHCTNLKEAVFLARKKAKRGDVVLLSPASASFDAFKNFEERGNKFKEYVNQLS